MARHRTAGSAAVLSAKKERKYGLSRRLKTESNRKRKQAKHQRMVEKKASRRVLFSLYLWITFLLFLARDVRTLELDYLA